MMDREFEERASNAKQFPLLLCSGFMGCNSKLAHSTIGEAMRGNGLECMMRLVKRLEPRTALAKRAEFKTITACIPYKEGCIERHQPETRVTHTS